MSNNTLLIFDFFSGTGSSTQAFVDAGHTVITFELDKQFEATNNIDVFDLTAERLIQEYGQPHFIWASPPCTAFSVASIGHHWTGGKGAHIPKTELAVKSQELVTHTRLLIEQLNPHFGFLIENPRGLLRKLKPVEGLQRHTITYCQYGDTRMKPTDLWGTLPTWEPREPCKNGDRCHEPAPRGARTGTQGLKGAKNRSRVPYELSNELCMTVEKLAGIRTTTDDTSNY